MREALRRARTIPRQRLSQIRAARVMSASNCRDPFLGGTVPNTLDRPRISSRRGAHLVFEVSMRLAKIPQVGPRKVRAERVPVSSAYAREGGYSTYRRGEASSLLAAKTMSTANTKNWAVGKQPHPIHCPRPVLYKKLQDRYSQHRFPTIPLESSTPKNFHSEEFFTPNNIHSAEFRISLCRISL